MSSGNGTAADTSLASSALASPQHTQIIAACVSIGALSLLSGLIGARWPLIKGTFLSFEPASPVWLARCAVKFVFFASWAFLASSGVLQFGVGLSRAPSVCHAAILLCIIVYALSKLFIFLFLALRAFTVAANIGERLLTSKPFLFNLFLILCSVAPMTMMILGRSHGINENRICYVGLDRVASFTLLGWDIFTSTVLASQFAWGLLHSHYTSLRNKRLAKRALVLAAVAMLSTAANLLSMGILKSEPSYACLTICSADIMVCSIALSLTSEHRDDEHRASAQPTSWLFTGSKDATAGLSEDPVPRLFLGDDGHVRTERVGIAEAAGLVSKRGSPKSELNGHCMMPIVLRVDPPDGERIEGTYRPL